MDTHLVFEGTKGLAELPYFALDAGGRLLKSDAWDSPVVDSHTHLALSYGPGPKPDLWRETARVEHYLPESGELDMDVYVNQNFTKSRRDSMARDLTLRSLGRKGMRATHTAANLRREMDELGIAVSLLLPIELPALSRNAERYLDVAEASPRFLSLGSVHPYGRRVGERLAEQAARGARGVKIHPAVQTLAADNARAMKVYRICGELGLPVLWHCGPVGIEPPLGRALSQVKHYWRPVRECPDTTFVLGHSGALQMEMALELALSHPNVVLELSSQSLPNVRRILEKAPPERVIFGSDWPFYHQGIALAKVLLATEEDPGARERILWENAARIFSISETELRAARPGS